MKLDNFFLKGFIIVFLSITPIWIFEYSNYLNLKFLGIIFLFVIIFYLILVVTRKKEKLNHIVLATIVAYGFDSKLGFWLIFEKILNDNSLLKYLASLIFLIFLFFLIFKIISKNEKFINLSIFFLTAVFLINLIPFHVISYGGLELENIENNFSNSKKPKQKTVILHLDELVGLSGIDTTINYGKEAKESYKNLFSKHGFNVYASAYTIYNDTSNSIPSLLNFDFQTENYNNEKYISWNNLDKKSKWRTKYNKFFATNSNKNIIASKGQSANFCDKWVSTCLYSNPQNYYNNYINDFEFSEIDFLIKQLHNQKSIIFQYFWRLGYKLNLFNDYHYFAFHKVKFENDLNNFANLIINSEADVYFLHSLFPHRPFVFSLDLKNKKCNFERKYLNDKFFDTPKKILQQHYKEIVCTNYYLDSFLEKIKNKIDNLEILLVSDTGTKTEDNDETKYLRDNYSVLFAIKNNNTDYKIYNNFISSQELFSKYFNPKHKENINDGNSKKKIHDNRTYKFIEISNFLNSKD